MSQVFQVFRVCVRRQLWRTITRRVPAAVSAGRVGSVPDLSQGVIRQLSSRDRGRVRGCTVDPNLEEEFVFLDCIEEDPHQEEKALIQQLQQQQQQISSPPPVSPPEHLHPPPQKQHLRSLERQLQALRGEAMQEPHPDSLIQFHDVDFPLDENLVAAKKKKKKKAGKSEHKVFGTPDVDEPGQ
ncbi:nitric oxide-associated protein 1 [Lates japonicus]|uniref:Nitric oxide-associated protein 1 n=1 Tax=Lates japonicus TaxID=270547 RepID=A0AAD3N830_LATJO|nr:nitric oxide-associated protein 1 [Lates japonicus]